MAGRCWRREVHLQLMMPSGERYMQRAIQLALRGAGHVSPNPMVGAVLVHEGRIIGEGWHHRYGDVHAEVDCLNNVAPEYKPLIPLSTMYVTLEPCAHEGKQPPCAHRLVAEGIRQVVVAVEDPFPQVSGQGIAILRGAGAEVSVGTCSGAARWMCRRFLSIFETGRPYIILKWAQSADGFIAPEDGSRKQLSNYLSQTLVHRWRTEESAILVGYNTALADNPQLTARHWPGPQPLRIVLDRALQLPRSHYLFDGSTRTWIINERVEQEEGTTRFLQLSSDNQLLTRLLERLKEDGRNSLIVEGGAKLLDSFIAAGLWDEARIFKTPLMLRTGIRAPSLTHSRPVFATEIGDDTLAVLQAAEGPFAFPSGAEL